MLGVCPGLVTSSKLFRVPGLVDKSMDFSVTQVCLSILSLSLFYTEHECPPELTFP